MFAIRQIIDDPQDVIAIPPELRHRRTEVIFIALDPSSDQPLGQDCLRGRRSIAAGGRERDDFLALAAAVRFSPMAQCATHCAWNSATLQEQSYCEQNGRPPHITDSTRLQNRHTMYGDDARMVTDHLYP